MHYRWLFAACLLAGSPALAGDELYPQQGGDVFNPAPAKAPAAAAPTESAPAPKKRWVGDEPDYNSAQREEWLEICAPKKEVDYAAYRECYFREKKRSRDGIKRQQSGVERQMQRGMGADPMRGGAPAPRAPADQD